MVIWKAFLTLLLKWYRNITQMFHNTGFYHIECTPTKICYFTVQLFRQNRYSFPPNPILCKKTYWHFYIETVMLLFFTHNFRCDYPVHKENGPKFKICTQSHQQVENKSTTSLNNSLHPQKQTKWSCFKSQVPYHIYIIEKSPLFFHRTVCLQLHIIISHFHICFWNFLFFDDTRHYP